MEQLILKTIDYVKHVSKRKVSLGSILQRINKTSATNSTTKPAQPILTTKPAQPILATKPISETSATNLDNETLKLELDQMIIKGLIDQSYKILHRDRLRLENVPSPDKVNFIFPNENGDNTGKFR